MAPPVRAVRDVVLSWYEGYVPPDGTIWITDPDARAPDGYDLVESDVFMLHRGPLPDVARVLGLTIEPVRSEDDLREYAVAVIKGFSDREDDPPESGIAEEMDQRRDEMTRIARLSIARLGGEVVAGRANYETDAGIQVYGLATRVPFRHKRIASNLLRELYRRLGFTEPVYWRRIYARRT